MATPDKAPRQPHETPEDLEQRMNSVWNNELSWGLGSGLADEESNRVAVGIQEFMKRRRMAQEQDERRLDPDWS